MVYALKIKEKTLTTTSTTPATRFKVFSSTLLANLEETMAAMVQVIVMTIVGRSSMQEQLLNLNVFTNCPYGDSRNGLLFLLAHGDSNNQMQQSTGEIM